MIDKNGGCGSEMGSKISATWNRWTDLTGVLYNKKVPTKRKVLLYKTFIRPTLMHDSETWPVTQIMEERIDATEMRVLRHVYRISYKDHVDNNEIRKQAGENDRNILIHEEKTLAVAWLCLSKR